MTGRLSVGGPFASTPKQSRTRRQGRDHPARHRPSPPQSGGRGEPFTSRWRPPMSRPPALPALRERVENTLCINAFELWLGPSICRRCGRPIGAVKNSHHAVFCCTCRPTGWRVVPQEVAFSEDSPMCGQPDASPDAKGHELNAPDSSYAGYANSSIPDSRPNRRNHRFDRSPRRRTFRGNDDCIGRNRHVGTMTRNLRRSRRTQACETEENHDDSHHASGGRRVPIPMHVPSTPAPRDTFEDASGAS